MKRILFTMPKTSGYTEVMMNEKIVKCPICGKPYVIMSLYAGNQSACPECVRKAEENMRKEYDKQ